MSCERKGRGRALLLLGGVGRPPGPEAFTQPVSGMLREILSLPTKKKSRTDQTQWLRGAGEEFMKVREHSRDVRVVKLKGELCALGFGSLSFIDSC